MKSHKEQLERKIEQFNTIFAHAPLRSDQLKLELKLLSRQMPSNYFFNYFVIRPENEMIIHYSWFVEIWGNDVCLFRESATNEYEENLHEFEEGLCSRILLNIFISSMSHEYHQKRAYAK